MAPKRLLDDDYSEKDWVHSGIKLLDENYQPLLKQVKLEDLLEAYHKKECRTSNIISSSDNVIILLDDFNSSSEAYKYLEFKFHTTCFLTSLFIQPQFKGLFESFGHDCIVDPNVKKCVKRITSTYYQNSIMKDIIKHYEFFRLSPEMLNDEQVVVNMITSNSDDEIINYMSADLQNDVTFLKKLIRDHDISFLSHQMSKMKLSTALKLIPPNDLYYYDFKTLPQRFQKKKEVFIKAIENGYHPNSIDESFKNEKDVILALLKNRCRINIPHQFKYDREIALAYLQNIGYLENFKLFSNDREVVSAAVKLNGRLLRYASADLRNDKEIAIQSFFRSNEAYKYISENLKNDQSFILEMVKIWPQILAYYGYDLRNDKSFMLKSIENHVSAFKYASDILKGDREIVLKAVKTKGDLLAYSSETLRNDKEIVLLAIMSDSSAFLFASDKLRNDKQFAIEAVKSDGTLLKYLYDGLRNDLEVVSSALAKLYIQEHMHKVFNFIPERFRNESNFMLQALKINVNVIEYASDRLKADKNFMFVAVSSNAEKCIHFVAKELHFDREFVLSCVKINWYTFEFFPPIWKYDKQIIIELLKQVPSEYSSLEQKLTNDLDVIMVALKDSSMFDHIPTEYKTNNNILIDLLSREHIYEDGEDDYEDSDEDDTETNRIEKTTIVGLAKCPPSVYEYASKSSDRNVIVQLVKHHEGALAMINSANYQYWTNDREVMLEILKHDHSQIVSSILLHDETFILDSIKFSPQIIKLIPIEVIRQAYSETVAKMLDILPEFACQYILTNNKHIDRSIILKLVRKYPKLISSTVYNGDKEIVFEAVSKDYTLFEIASKELQRDREFILSIAHLGMIGLYIDKSLIRDWNFMVQISMKYFSNIIRCKKEGVDNILNFWKLFLKAKLEEKRSMKISQYYNYLQNSINLLNFYIIKEREYESDDIYDDYYFF